MSEKDEQSASRKGSVFFQNAKLPRRTKAPSKAAKKRAPKKGPKASYAQVFESDKDDDLSDDVEDDDNSSVGLTGIYSMMDRGHSNSNSESNSDSEDEEDNSSVSSSDDSEVDFVQLQAERRANAKSHKSLKAIKALQKQQNAKDKKRRKSDYRRQSELPLPDSINFKFDFDDAANESAIEDDSDQEDPLNVIKPAQPEEEDVGEEVTQDLGDKQSYNLNFQFDEPIIDVPKIKDDELQSDDDYEFDDNDLLATLQADNDIEEFITGNPQDIDSSRSRQRSVSSVNEDETMDPFLEEEEKYLVNEFEMNGFDDENEIQDEPGKSDFAKGIGQPTFQDKVTEYDNAGDNSKSDTLDGYIEDDEDEDEVDFMDLMEFDAPLFETDSKESESSLSDLKNDADTLDGPVSKSVSPEKRKKSSHKKRKKPRGPLDSEEEDDSYLWNYFLSSDSEADADVNAEPVDVEEQLILEEILRQEKETREATYDREFSLEPLSDQEYDSGESTDVDTSLPKSGKNQNGSKMAKEVLSSKTADYRPPVLGTWVAIESKPFGIIDGLSTRTLKSGQNTQKNPRTKGWKSISLGNNEHEDSAIELEELLNISELDNDDENDIRIWRDFNNSKKKVPLGAFRNKSHLHQPHTVHEPIVNFRIKNDFGTGRRKKERRASQSNDTGHDSPDSSVSKAKRRRASAMEAASEGYRHTKSGLFSANVLTDAEEVMGEDRDFMALIKGL
ncbi:uncharacterized protein CXQ87_003048 [Candidozyma duobushaemuli]|nr:uncharacterized protein CXQ87_003048 [[Candida] duobushaemulonis]PVH15211.1 hypothetical protein CXQ87_003048 [[Candida] duobushaemulonis]